VAFTSQQMNPSNRNKKKKCVGIESMCWYIVNSRAELSIPIGAAVRMALWQATHVLMYTEVLFQTVPNCFGYRFRLVMDFRKVGFSTCYLPIRLLL
jgi:hypothetical protein